MRVREERLQALEQQVFRVVADYQCRNQGLRLIGHREGIIPAGKAQTRQVECPGLCKPALDWVSAGAWPRSGATGWSSKTSCCSRAGWSPASAASSITPSPDACFVPPPTGRLLS